MYVFKKNVKYLIKTQILLLPKTMFYIVLLILFLYKINKIVFLTLSRVLSVRLVPENDHTCKKFFEYKLNKHHKKLTFLEPKTKCKYFFIKFDVSELHDQFFTMIVNADTKNN